MFCFVQLSGYDSEVQVRLNKIDDFGAITAYKTMIFKIFSVSWVYLLDHYLGFPKWYKTLFSVKNFGFYKSLRNKINKVQKLPKNHVLT